MVEDEPYLLELARYLRLNPVRAGVITTPGALDRYPWTGHSALMATVPRPWKATDTILLQFGRTARRGRRP
jgi:putative transposase